MKKLFLNKWFLVVPVIFIIAGTIFYLHHDQKPKRTANKETVDTQAFRKELKPKIDEFTTKYNDSIEKDWLPSWEEIHTNQDTIDKNKIVNTMHTVSKQYEILAKEMDTFKAEDSISTPALKEKMNEFRTEFIAASNFMKDAAESIIDGCNNSIPLNEAIENTKHALGLADQHIITALSTLNEIKDKLGITKN
ncbi:hypothetical protein D0U04_07485 [Bacillus clarus]|uniref:Uncharacterized protein n=1 Tax=Bacillus clarus TaxID=2338372 RepID=A0A090YSD0_9BACI|nr:hypothetical protein [Bacillus clarus]KFN01127.1 hypothetical protein DJ93_4836 [Bacillus clarus]RFT67608.1 hypothetical protein D0U04_07485 [Bacillus clarus]